MKHDYTAGKKKKDCHICQFSRLAVTDGAEPNAIIEAPLNKCGTSEFSYTPPFLPATKWEQADFQTAVLANSFVFTLIREKLVYAEMSIYFGLVTCLASS